MADMRVGRGYGGGEWGRGTAVADGGKWHITWKLEPGLLLAGRGDFRLSVSDSAALWAGIPWILDCEERRATRRLSSPSW